MAIVEISRIVLNKLHGRILSMKGNHAWDTAAAVCEAEYLKVIGSDLYDVVPGRSIDTIPSIGCIKIDLITLVGDEIRRIIGPKGVRRRSGLIMLTDRICAVEIDGILHNI